MPQANPDLLEKRNDIVDPSTVEEGENVPVQKETPNDTLAILSDEDLLSRRAVNAQREKELSDEIAGMPHETDEERQRVQESIAKMQRQYGFPKDPDAITEVPIKEGVMRLAQLKKEQEELQRNMEKLGGEKDFRDLIPDTNTRQALRDLKEKSPEKLHDIPATALRMELPQIEKGMKDARERWAKTWAEGAKKDFTDHAKTFIGGAKNENIALKLMEGKVDAVMSKALKEYIETGDPKTLPEVPAEEDHAVWYEMQVGEVPTASGTKEKFVLEVKVWMGGIPKEKVDTLKGEGKEQVETAREEGVLEEKKK